MGLLVSVYRGVYTSKNNAFDGKSQIVVVNIAGPFEPNDKAPAAMVHKNAFGDPIIVPVAEDGGPMGYVAMGGSYAGTSDGRFREAVGIYGAVPIHDYRLSMESGDHD